jgi:beta-lactamase regulating signal transducer with metallopeptidase domain
MAICWYLLEANIYLTIAYLFYALVLKRYTFFQQHRFYLLIVSVCSFIIPLISCKTGGIIGSGETLNEALSTMPSVNPDAIPVVSPDTFQLMSFDVAKMLLMLLAVVAIVKIFRLINGVIKLVLLHRRSVKVVQNGVSIALLPQQQTVFSFFNLIFSHHSFLNDRMIHEHELIHVRELHSVDLIWFELVKAVNWFNPVSYLLLKSAKINHEFIVDAKLVEKNDPYEYALMLISHARTHSSSLTHAAFASGQMEARVNKMTETKSPGSSRGILLFLFPVMLPLIFFSVFKLEKNYALLTIVSSGQPFSASSQEKMNNTPLRMDSVTNNARQNNIVDTTPEKKENFLQKKSQTVSASKQAVNDKDSLSYRDKKTVNPNVSIFTAAVDDRHKNDERLHNKENDPGMLEKESVYGKYALLAGADTSGKYDKNLRRAVSIYPEKKYADPSVREEKFVGPVSVYDSTRHKSAFPNRVVI